MLIEKTVRGLERVTNPLSRGMDVVSRTILVLMVLFKRVRMTKKA
jgi:hypothetical protein